MKQMYWKGEFTCLKIPVQKDTEPVELNIENNRCVIWKKKISLAKTRIDEWELLLMPCKGEVKIKTQTEAALNLIVPCEDIETAWDEVYGEEQQIFHLFSEPEICEILYAKEKNQHLELLYKKNRDEPSCVIAFSENMLTWQGGEVIEKGFSNLKVIHTKNIQGDIEKLYLYEDCGRKIILGIGIPQIWNGKKGNSLLLPMQEKGGMILPAADMKRLRTWKRMWKDEKIDRGFLTGLRFRIAPSVWPNIRILAPEGKEDDISAEAYEVNIKIKPDTAKKVRMNFCGILLEWDSDLEVLAWEKGSMYWPSSLGILSIRGYVDRKCGEFFGGGKALFLNRIVEKQEKAVDNVSGNLEKCAVTSIQENVVEICAEEGAARLLSLTVYGLRGLKYEPDTQKIIHKMEKGRILFKDSAYTIFHNGVSDEQYGKPDAYVPDKDSIISLVRPVEEFQWRETKWGDMVRVLNRKEIWHPSYEINEYPEISTGIPVVDAAYRLALDTFCLCKSKEYALPGQEGLWSAGGFQGKGQGFGVWMRDSAHVALRCGSLIDPQTARKTLLYTTKKGFDNGCDGAATVIVGLWDYYLITNDISAVYEAWPALLKNIEKIEKEIDEERGLVYAPQSTSNDAFEEPECGGYCLSTEVYNMKAFEAMAYLGKKLGYKEEKLLKWKEWGKRMRGSIQEKYWNTQYGYFTSGPKGSLSFEKGYWETSGAESVLWNKFGVADQKQKQSVLHKMEEKAMTQYGIVLFPDRKEKNHFCGSIWNVWEAGIAAAAAETGNYDIAYRLLFQQIRSCIMNKTFYEVIDADSGMAWRWPAQLWHAAGFISVLYYGILGISCNEEGMSFLPMLRKEWKGTKIRNLKYGKANLHIDFVGIGKFKEMYMDGNKIDGIPREIQGEHQIKILLETSEFVEKDC